jgi:hypothetical protein
VKINIFRIMILPGDRYGCETRSHIKERYRLMLFENKVLRRIFGPKRDEVVGG